MGQLLFEKGYGHGSCLVRLTEQMPPGGIKSLGTLTGSKSWMVFPVWQYGQDSAEDIALQIYSATVGVAFNLGVGVGLIFPIVVGVGAIFSRPVALPGIT